MASRAPVTLTSVHPVQVGGGDVEQPGPPGDAGVRDQPVDPAVPFGQILGERGPAGLVGDVQLPVLDAGQLLGRPSAQVQRR